MCGVVGFVDLFKHSDLSHLKLMNETLYHRGPDGGDHYFNKNDFASIGLGHRRLSIIDLKISASQPMYYKNWIIVFNGEIYNFKEIREELVVLGNSFVTNSDTEVILQAFDMWGNKAVNKFIGMFAFVIYNQLTHKLFIFRDRAGVKPLYYYYDNSLLLFSSEIKAFHKHPNFKKDLNLDSVAQFLQFGYILSPNTIFQNTFKLNPGHYLEIDAKTLKISENVYWDISDFYNKPKLKISHLEAFSRTKDLLKSACEYRMISDVPVGIFLSGGYDSSLVAGILQSTRTEKLKTFTIGFDDKKYDESFHAESVAKYLNTDHQTYICSINDARKLIPQIPEYFDEPFSDPSVIPTMLVSEKARNKVTVALSADAGDELFGGYSKYKYLTGSFNKIRKIPFGIRHFVAEFLAKIDPNDIPYFNKTYNFKTRFYKGINLLSSQSFEGAFCNIGKYFSDSEVYELFNNKVFVDSSKFLNTGLKSEFSDIISSMLCTDFKTYLVDDILTKVDRSSMRVGLEGREPLLDHRLAEWVAQLPNEFKINSSGQKILLKEITHSYIPESIMSRPKMGFGIPLVEWFKKDIRKLIFEFLNPDFIRNQGIFKIEAINKIVFDYEKNNSQNVFKLWNLLMFQLWYKKWVFSS